MTLLWSENALLTLQQLQRGTVSDASYRRLVRRLVLLENDASTFEAVYEPLCPEETSLCAHVMEADPGQVFVIWYRLLEDSEDVWLVGLDHG